MAETFISLILSNKLSELDALTRGLEQFGAAAGLSTKCIFELSLAMEELFSNIVAHGYPENTDHWIRIHISRKQEMLIIRLEDEGVPFDPNLADIPDISCSVENRKIGGLGVHLIKHLMNDIVYKRCGNRNILILKKFLAAS